MVRRLSHPDATRDSFYDLRTLLEIPIYFYGVDTYIRIVMASIMQQGDDDGYAHNLHS